MNCFVCGNYIENKDVCYDGIFYCSKRCLLIEKKLRAEWKKEEPLKCAWCNEKIVGLYAHFTESKNNTHLGTCATGYMMQSDIPDKIEKRQTEIYDMSGKIEYEDYKKDKDVFNPEYIKDYELGLMNIVRRYFGDKPYNQHTMDRTPDSIDGFFKPTPQI